MSAETNCGVPGAPGPMASVRAFAGQNPAAFIGGALAVGWLLGRLLSSDDDES